MTKLNRNWPNKPAPLSVPLHPEIYARLVNEALEHIDPLERHSGAAIDAYVAVRADELLRHALRMNAAYDPDF